MSKTHQELYKHFRDQMFPKLTKLEAARKALLEKYTLWSIVPAGVIVPFLLWALSQGFFTNFEGVKTVLIFVAVVVSLYLAAVTWHYRRTDFYRMFKKDVIEGLVTFISDDVRYEQSGYVTRDRFYASTLYSTEAETYEGDDRFLGTIGKTGFEASELHLAYYVRTKNGRRRVPIFDGLFFIADFNKHMSGITKVEPDIAESTFGFLGTSLQKMTAGDRLVKLEDPVFEKLFKVTSTDQVEARYIITPSMMQRIVEFKEKAKSQVRLAFLGSSVYIAVSHEGQLFEPNVFASLLDFAPIREYFSDISLALGIIEDLDLNTRIWTKQ